MQNVLEHLSARIPILVEILEAAAGKTGLTVNDIAFAFFDAQGATETLGSGDYTLTEVDSVEFPGLYLVTEYPNEDTPTTFLTAFPGVVRLKWSAIPAATFDDGFSDLRVGEDLRQVRATYRVNFDRLEWNADDERWDLYDPDDVLQGWFPARDVNENAPVIEGTHPVTRLKFVPDPAYPIV